MKTLPHALLLLALLAPPPAAAQSSIRGISYDEVERAAEESMRSRAYDQESVVQHWDARLKPVGGQVSVRPAGSEEWSEISEETPLEASDMVRTGPEGRAQLFLDDKGVFLLDRNTELEVASVGQPEMTLAMKFGALVARINKVLDSKFRLEVRTPTAVCAVRGTEFAVEYSRLAKDTAAAVFDEGRLSVTPLDEAGNPGQEQTLEKNTELVMAASQKRFRAVQLSRMMRHRAQLSSVRDALKERRKGWKRLSRSGRAELRQRALKRAVIRRQLPDRGRQAAPRGQGKVQRVNKARPGAQKPARQKRRAAPARGEYGQ